MAYSNQTVHPRPARRIHHTWQQGGVLLLLICLGGCDVLPGSGNRGNPDELVIATWNIQALFDGVEAGTEYDDYRNTAGWSGEKYQARLLALAEAIRGITPRNPDILAFQEVENAGILSDLAEGPLKDSGYRAAFFAHNSGAALGIGVLSRFPLTQTRAHSVTGDGGTTPRPVLELWLQPGGKPGDKPLVLFVCHWKSKLGGDDETEVLRRASARVIRRRIQEIEQEQPGTAVVIMGDLNENHDEFYRRAGTVLSALLPDDPMAAELAGFSPSGGGSQTDFLILSREKPPESRYFSRDAVVLYSPWEHELQRGSYNYQSEWETIDHFLLNNALFDNSGWEFTSCEALYREPFIAANGLPKGYNPRTGYGLSDHLPLLLTLQWLE
jgi:endonuclease/exonuclease/phosphatase family metal-dependent hydrolase